MEEKQRGLFVISVANQKGGVGKTTSVSSLAGAFAKMNKNVMLIDLDIQANLTITFGLDPLKVTHSISDVLFNSYPLSSVCRQTRIAGVDLVPANKEMELVERFLPLRPDYKQIMSNSINESGQNNARHPVDAPIYQRNFLPKTHYDYVLMDCPPSIGPITINALVASHLLIIPTQPEYYSTYALHSMVTNMDQVRKKFNPQLKFRLLITMFDRRNRIHTYLSHRLRDNFPQLLFDTVIGVDTQLREASLVGLPITHFRARSRSALQYQSLAEEIEELLCKDY